MPGGTERRAAGSGIRPRTITRYGVLLLGGAIAADRLADAWRSWREWHRWAVADPSGADLYETDFWIASTIAVVVLSIASLSFWLLKPETTVATSENPPDR